MRGPVQHAIADADTAHASRLAAVWPGRSRPHAQQGLDVACPLFYKTLPHALVPGKQCSRPSPLPSTPATTQHGPARTVLRSSKPPPPTGLHRTMSRDLIDGGLTLVNTLNAFFLSAARHASIEPDADQGHPTLLNLRRHHPTDPPRDGSTQLAKGRQYLLHYQKFDSSIREGKNFRHNFQQSSWHVEINNLTTATWKARTSPLTNP